MTLLYFMLFVFGWFCCSAVFFLVVTITTKLLDGEVTIGNLIAFSLLSLTGPLGLIVGFLLIMSHLSELINSIGNLPVIGNILKRKVF